jgi:arsenite transporter
VDTRATISCALSSRNSTEITRRQHFDRHHVAGNVVLATVVGMLIEVPVMLAVAKIVNRTRGWYERAPIAND